MANMDHLSICSSCFCFVLVWNLQVIFNMVCLCAVQSAKLTAVGGLFSSKPDPYLELVVDGQNPRKTEVVKKTTTPKWDEPFTV